MGSTSVAARFVGEREQNESVVLEIGDQRFVDRVGIASLALSTSRPPHASAGHATVMGERDAETDQVFSIDRQIYGKESPAT
jgi:hypothetical protein